MVQQPTSPVRPILHAHHSHCFSGAVLLLGDDSEGGSVEHGHVHEHEDVGGDFHQHETERIFLHRRYFHWNGHRSYLRVWLISHVSQDRIGTPILEIREAVI